MGSKATAFFLFFSAICFAAASANTCSIEIVGKSETIKFLRREAVKLATYDVPILIEGPQGSGKTLFANFIHENSLRREKFACLDFSTVSPQLWESKLFGCKQESGVLEEAQGGTLFLDRIEELPLELQGKLLNTIESGYFRRVDGNETLKLEVRVIATTRIDLEQAVKEGKFREDLYLCLKGFQMKVPSLSKRLEDIKRLSSFFLKKLAVQYGIQEIKYPFHNVLKIFKAYPWPGNVRELIQVLTVALVRANNDEAARFISVKHLPENLINPIATPDVLSLFSSLAKSEDLPPLSAIEESYMQFVLSRAGGIKKRAAIILGVNRSTLIERLRKIEERTEHE